MKTVSVTCRVVYRKKETIRAALLVDSPRKVGEVEILDMHTKKKLVDISVPHILAQDCLSELCDLACALERQEDSFMVQRASEGQPAVWVFCYGGDEISKLRQFLKECTEAAERDRDGTGHRDLLPAYNISVSSKGKTKVTEVEVFKNFYRQQDAFDRADTLMSTLSLEDGADLSRLKVYSYESQFDGSRRFLVANLPDFISTYMETDARKRHAYEIIREGYPCRAYFDLEYSIEQNPDVDGHHLTERWIQLICNKIHALFGLYVGPDDVVCLDSTSDVKFSRHIILHVHRPLERTEGQRKRRRRSSTSSHVEEDRKEVLFKNNLHVGALVDLVMWDMTEPVPLPKSESTDGAPQYMQYSRRPRREFADMWLLAKDSKNGTRGCFVDTTVYTRNRAFRLPFSSKYGKETRFHFCKRALTAAIVDASPGMLLPLGTPPSTPQAMRSLESTTENPLEYRRQAYTDYLMRAFVVPAADLTDVSTLAVDAAQYSGVRLSCNMLEPDGRVLLSGAGFRSYKHRSAGMSLSSSSASPSRAGDRAALGDPFWRDMEIASSDVPLPVELQQENLPHLPRMTPMPTPTDSNGDGGAGLGTPLSSQHIVLDGSAMPSTGAATAAHLRAGPAWTHATSTASLAKGTRPGAFTVRVSPFPTVDHTAAAECSRGGVVGEIYRWRLYCVPTREGQKFRIRYLVNKNKFCGNINRQHKSNGIFLEADLNRGVLYQSCWDPDCRGYRSPPVSLHGCPSIAQLEDMALDAQLMKTISSNPNQWA